MDVPKLICNHLLLQKMWLDFEAELWLPMFITLHIPDSSCYLSQRNHLIDIS